MRYLSVILLIFGLTGCTLKQQPVEDLHTISQSATNHWRQYFDQTTTLSSPSEQARARDYLEHFFKPWIDIKTPSEQEIFWGVSYANSRPWVGMNRLPIPRSAIDSIVANADREAYQAEPFQRGITIQETTVRVLPTDTPFFLDFTQAGEGYPFDYLQSSWIPPNTPLKILHTSQDGLWQLCRTPRLSGWIKRRDIALVDETFQMAFMHAPLLVVQDDSVVLQDMLGESLGQARIGMLLPLLGEQAGIWQAGVAKPGAFQQAQWESVLLFPEQAARFPATLDHAGLTAQMDRMMTQPYGWGGLGGNRDCSLLLADLFAPFGIWLPRNSRAQIHQGEAQKIPSLLPEEKKRFIIEHAKPFQTILYMPGHIVLYIGEKEGEPLVFHSSWGVKTLWFLQEGRNIIGQTAITTLEPGRELDGFDPEKTMLQRITHLRHLF